jgi:hypothetical protein
MLSEDDSQLIGSRSQAATPSTARPNDPTDPMLQVAAVIPQIQRAFRSAVAPTMTLASIDEQLLALLGPHMREADAAPDYLPAPGSLWMMVHIYSIQLILHRHNFSPASAPEARQAALECCAKVASDTARLLLRVDDIPPNTPDTAAYASRFIDIARRGPTSLLILHLWRCIMHLVYSFDFEGALICTRLAARLIHLRPVNRCCGHYLEFFLDTIRSKLHQERPNFLEDEELMAYLSADLQNNLDQAWIWTGSDLNSPRGAQLSNGVLARSPAIEPSAWNNWSGVVALVQQLADEYGPAARRFSEQPNHVMSQTSPLPPPPTSSSKVSSRPNTSNTSASTLSPSSVNNRINIADLMG